MRKALRWLWDHWWLVLFAVGVFFGWFLSRGPGNDDGENPIEVVKHKKKVIDAKAEAAKAKAELGAEKATQEVKKKYEAEMQAFDTKQKEKARELENDPEALAEFILLAGK